MSRAARTALVVVGVALVAVVAVIVWLTMRENQPAATPIPPVSEARVVTADPSIALPSLVDVPGTADGCPAAAFRAPTDPAMAPTEGYAAIMLPSGDGAALLAACIGDVEDVGRPEEFVRGLWTGEGFDDAAEEAAWERLSIERVTSPLGDALAVTSRIGGKVLTDHYVERDGWVYAVGYLRDEADGDVDRAVVDAVLASWQWR